MDFYQTQMGQRFFNLQLPKLIHALEDLSEKLSSPRQTISLPVETDPDVLDRLYVRSDAYEPTDTSKQLNKAIIQQQRDLLPLLSPQAQEMFEAYQQVMADRDSEFGRHAYRVGFQDATQMILAGLASPSHGSEDTPGDD